MVKYFLKNKIRNLKILDRCGNKPDRFNSEFKLTVSRVACSRLSASEERCDSTSRATRNKARKFKKGGPGILFVFARFYTN